VSQSRIPSYLQGYEALYERDPRAAALAWFADARFGLFMHYGLYSLLGRHEWVMYIVSASLCPSTRRWQAGSLPDDLTPISSPIWPSRPGCVTSM